MKTTGLLLTCLLLIAAPVQAQMDDTATPQPLVDAYDSLADTILAAKQTEWNLVHSIVGGTYKHAEAVAKQAMAKLDAGENASMEIEKLAALVGQLGNEGDASVAAVRKRLLEGGHHHNAAGEEMGIYDEGFVIVTRVARKELLEIAGRIGRQSQAPAVAALEAEWAKVAAVYGRLTAK